MSSVILPVSCAGAQELMSVIPAMMVRVLFLFFKMFSFKICRNILRKKNICIYIYISQQECFYMQAAVCVLPPAL